MPARMKPLRRADGPLSRFALELRLLRSQAPAGRQTSIKVIANTPGCRASRAAIYAALSGKVLPSQETLRALVEAWAPHRAKDLPAWMARRDECEAELAVGARRHGQRINEKSVATQRVGFGTHLREYRLQAGLSLADLARRVHYSKSYLSKVENGLVAPTLGLVRLCDAALGTSGVLISIVEPER